MKNKFLALISCFTLLSSVFFMSSCEGSGVNHISGLYSYVEPWDSNYRIVINFINSNTVINYSTVSRSTSGWGDGVVKLAEIPGHPGWYYSTCSVYQYTYYIDGNKIYIPQQNKIITINSDGSLQADGSSIKYYKW